MPQSSRARWLSALISAILFAGLGVAVLSVRLLVDGKRFYEEAELGQTAQLPWRKVVSKYENAAKTYFPGNPYSQWAFWRLSVLAKSAQMRGEQERALYIWEVVRRSAVSQRHLWQPQSRYIAESRRNIQRLRGASVGEWEKGDRLEDPGVLVSIAICAGLLLWIWGAATAVFSSGRQTVVRVSVSVLGSLMWIIASILA